MTKFTTCYTKMPTFSCVFRWSLCVVHALACPIMTKTTVVLKKTDNESNYEITNICEDGQP